ncbi:MAG: disulfide bond formation protein B [Gammaproteobacteria bacterium]|nr:disulfide bond formation protein B [Gammaproteobacteria bacterium]MDH3407270.1 disulfide bond formation protein B [Gammaproteobacteria bacterium]MDH3563715.1 disulfide bond formation protein B [Gammaproteobacteria bacterium]MDH5486420.1 disulfide bond formation protein B [Gammaproteobacteria bacterium]
MSQRIIFLGGFLICAGLMGAALFFQYVMNLEPCPLCIFQRIFVIVIGLVLLAGALHNPETLGRRVYGGLTVPAAALGAGVAGRHVWIQNLPFDQQPGCGYSLNDMLESFPLQKTLKLVFEGSGGCGQVLWSFLGLSMPGWVLLFFLGFTVLGFLLIFSRFGGR